MPGNCTSDQDVVNNAFMLQGLAGGVMMCQPLFSFLFLFLVLPCNTALSWECLSAAHTGCCIIFCRMEASSMTVHQICARRLHTSLQCLTFLTMVDSIRHVSRHCHMHASTLPVKMHASRSKYGMLGDTAYWQTSLRSGASKLPLRLSLL